MNETKGRTPSRCREWERQRRIKFNEAITQLCETVKAVCKATDPSYKDPDNAQYPKVEIIQRAILCITNCEKQTTQLKAEILALQVKLEAKLNKKDASTQVSVRVPKKTQGNKYSKVAILKKSKRNALKEKQNEACNKNGNGLTTTSSIYLPKLLPKVSSNEKKGTDNTLVVVGARPWLLPARAAPCPTLFLLGPTLHNPTVINRIHGDVTKTTMVNILPISAYSKPLSATKHKKNNIKLKTESKKIIKKDAILTKNKVKVNITSVEYDENVSSTANKENAVKKVVDKAAVSNEISRIPPASVSSDKSSQQESSKPLTSVNETKCNLKPQNKISEQIVASEANLKESTTQSTTKLLPSRSTEISTTSAVVCNTSVQNITYTTASTNFDCSTSVKNTGSTLTVSTVPMTSVSSNHTRKDTFLIEKDKENKLPNILDTSLCDSAAEAGNTRLELAEELLAASPTAAFLLSFPVVSAPDPHSGGPPHLGGPLHSTKQNAHKRNDINHAAVSYFDKPDSNLEKTKSISKSQSSAISSEKLNKFENMLASNKPVDIKFSTVSTVCNENPFLSLPSIVSSGGVDSTFGLEFDCIGITKSMPSNNSNLFYKSDPFNTVKSAIYSTSTMSSNHDFNSLGLYPCAVEKYGSKNKSEFANVDENLMKIGSSRLTYDIDLGWSHKGFDFVTCTTASNTYKDNILPSSAVTYSSAYNPFSTDFHVPLVPTTTKEITSKATINTFPDPIPSFYSQPTNLWSDDVPYYNNNNTIKTVSSRQQNYFPFDNLPHAQTMSSKSKITTSKQVGSLSDNNTKSVNIFEGMNTTEKYTKKSPSKMHINWMTSETRPVQNDFNIPQTEAKEFNKSSYTQFEPTPAVRKDHSEGNYFPITVPSYSEELPVWPPRPGGGGPTEVTIEPPPINLPTLVGDLALGPHDKKKTFDTTKSMQHNDIQNCGNFFSVTQLMNRSNNNVPSRFHGQTIEAPKEPSKSHFHHDISRKTAASRVENNFASMFTYSDSKIQPLSDPPAAQYQQLKTKINKTDKISKAQKNNYSAEALLRGGSCNQRVQDNNMKFGVHSQKYNDFNVQDSGVAQVSHFPAMLDYTDATYAGPAPGSGPAQQLSGPGPVTLYNSGPAAGAIPNSFYPNFMSSNYPTAFSGDYIDYNQQSDCNYNNKYDDSKTRHSGGIFHQDKLVNYKSSRREAVKHKLECTKKDSSKKLQSKRVKMNNEVEEWGDGALWHTKPERRPALEDGPQHVYTGPAPGGGDAFGARGPAHFPATSRANFNLSTIFPEITMKVQS